MAKILDVKVEELVPEFVQLAKRGKGHLTLQHTMNALSYLADMYRETWVNAAEGAAFDGLPFVINSTRYQHTIQRRQISPTCWEVYSDYTTKSGRGVTDLLEAGHGLIDLKKGLLNGPKSRLGKNGRYNIVAFRHGTPGSDQFRNNPMPISVYKDFKSQMKEADAQRKAGASAIGGVSYISKSGAQAGKTIWGSKFSPDSLRGQRSKRIIKSNKRGQQKQIGHYTWKAGKYAGMVGLQQSTSRSKRTGYMTFRIVTAHSDPMSWIVPEQAPWPVRKAVIDFMRPFAEQILQEAMEADIK